MRRVEKAEALELLAVNRQALLGDDTSGCVMCALVTLAQREPQSPEVIVQNEHGAVLFDRFGTTAGHLLVIAREHLLDTAELPWPVYSELQRLNYEACCALRRAFQPPRVFSAVLGTSSELPMSFPHFHIHALPVYETDERARPAYVFSWTAGVLVYEEDDVRRLSDQIRAAWPKRES
jgi:diadenosine tetraphosphate (Ap4A) HIT family hydrolase